MKKKTRRYLLCIAIVVVSGVVRLPLEAGLEDQMTEAGFREGAPGLELREELGQMGFVAAFGGLRSLVASILDLWAFVAFTDDEWGEVDSRYSIICRLQPKVEKYWELASWHMAYNAVAYYERSETATDSMRLAVRTKLMESYKDKGISYLERGLVFLPDSGKLHLSMASIHKDRRPNPAIAAHHYLRAFECQGLGHLERAHAHELVKFSEREAWEQAYSILKRHYDSGGRDRTLSVLRDLRVLEDRLQIPVVLRIPETP